MPSSVDNSRVHSNPGAVARKRVRYAVAVLAIFGLFLYATSPQRVVHGGSDVPLVDSQKAFSRLKTLQEDSQRQNSDADLAADGKEVVLEHDSNLLVDSDAKGKSTVHEDAGSDDVNKNAKIITCPACKLNSLPSVKKFVHEIAPNFAPKLEVEFIMGEDPTLHIYNNGKESRTVPLEVSTISDQQDHIQIYSVIFSVFFFAYSLLTCF